MSKSRQQNITFDGVGYVNNQGDFSKYWGVSFYYKDHHAKRFNQKSIRIILVDPDTHVKHDIKATAFTLSENVAASVAGFFFEGIQKFLTVKLPRNNPFTRTVHYIVYNGWEYQVNLNNNTISVHQSIKSKNTCKGNAAPYKAPEHESESGGSDCVGDPTPVITLDAFSKDTRQKKKIVGSSESQTLTPVKVEDHPKPDVSNQNNIESSLIDMIRLFALHHKFTLEGVTEIHSIVNNNCVNNNFIPKGK